MLDGALVNIGVDKSGGKTHVEWCVISPDVLCGPFPIRFWASVQLFTTGKEVIGVDPPYGIIGSYPPVKKTTFNETQVGGASKYGDGNDGINGVYAGAF